MENKNLHFWRQPYLVSVNLGTVLYLLGLILRPDSRRYFQLVTFV